MAIDPTACVKQRTSFQLSNAYKMQPNQQVDSTYPLNR